MNRRLSVRDRVLAVVRARMFLHNWWHHINSLCRAFPDLYSATRSFISPASFNIFNRLCDNLIALVISFAKYYPDHPFCPWLMGTEFIEHFFGLARSLLPDFAYAELLKMVKHIMLRQKLLLGGKFDDKRERNSRSGYILDYDASPLTERELMEARVDLTTIQINQLVDLGHREADAICRDLLHMVLPKAGTLLVSLVGPTQGRKKTKANSQRVQTSDTEYDSDEWEGDEEDASDDDTVDDEVTEDADEASTAIAAARDAARYAELCEQYDATVAESQTQPTLVFIGPSLPPVPPPSLSPVLVLNSELFDNSGKLSILNILDSRSRHQSGTTTRSERVLELDPKFSKAKATTDGKDAEVTKLTSLSVKEGSHRVRVAQDIIRGDDKPKKIRQMRWQMVANELARIVPVKGLF